MNRKLPLIALLAAVACTSEAGESPSPSSSALPSLSLAAAPRISIGGMDERPEYSFSVVSEGAFLGGDRFVILDPQAYQLKVYSTSGEHLSTFGRRGEGPGELGRLPRLLTTGDGTIRIWDGLQQRLTVFDGTGRYLSSTRPMEGTEIRFVQLAGALSDNRVVWKQPGESRAEEDAPVGHYRDSTFHVIRDPDGTSDTLAWTFAAEAYRGSADGQQLSTRVPFGREGFAVVGGDRLIYGVSDEPLLRSRNPDGSDGPTFRWEVERSPVSGREIDSLRTESAGPWRERLQTGGPQLVAMAGAQLQVIEDAPARETRPHFVALHVNGAGDVLVRLATDLFSATNEWILFDRDGSARGTFSSPRDFQILDFTRADVLGYTLDDFDLPTVEVRALDAG